MLPPREDLPPWCLVMALWGDRYGPAHVNELVGQAAALSPSLAEVVLVTDRVREGLDPRVRQTLFPEFFLRPELRLGGYRIKLAGFRNEALPPDRRCLFVDLDTVVIGDLGRIAALVREPDDCWMMPPAGLGFSPVARLGSRLRRGVHVPIGNSSIVAFHSGRTPSIAEAFEARYRAGIDLTERYMKVDDIFISWLLRGRVRGIPKSLAVSFRREFMARAWPILWLRRASPFRRKRREGLVAITFNGLSVKPEVLAELPEGGPLRDAYGRVGYWSDAHIGPARARILDSVARVLASPPPPDHTSSPT